MALASGVALGVDRPGVVGQSLRTLKPCRAWNRPSPLTRRPGKTESGVYLDFVYTNVHAYFKGILFHYYYDFPYICLYCWKGNILKNLYLLKTFFRKSRNTIIYSKWLKIYWPNSVSYTSSKDNKKTNNHTRITIAYSETTVKCTYNSIC